MTTLKRGSKMSKTIAGIAIAGLGIVTLMALMAGAYLDDVRYWQGYVIGPDIDGRLCHVATCFSLAEAKETAKRLNDQFNKGKSNHV